MKDEYPPGAPADLSGQGPGESLASVGRSAAFLTGAAASVQILGMVRELFLASKVGISTDFDALLVGLVLPATLSSVLTVGLATALVPAYIEARSKHGSTGARRLAGTVLAYVAIAAVVVSALLMVLAPGTVIVTGPGLSPFDREQAVGYLRLVAPMTVAAGVFGILSAVCQAEEEFRSIAWSVLAGPAATLALTLALWDRLGLGAFAVGTVVGPFVGLAVLLMAMTRRKVMPRPYLWSPGLQLGALARHAFPLTVSSGILQINAIFDRAVATLISPGAVSALRYGDTLVRVPTGAISPAWGAAIYPALVRSANESERAGLASAAARALRYVVVVFVPLSALTMAVAPIGVSVAYGRGAFTLADLQLTALVVAGFAPLVIVLMISQTLNGALNARRSGKVLLAAGTINVIVNCSLDVIFGFSLGVAGVAASSSVTAVVVAMFKARQLARREDAFALRPLARSIILATFASLPGALVCGVLAWTGRFPGGLAGGLLTLVASGIFVLVTYVAVADRLGLHEPRILVGQMMARLAGGIRRVGGTA